MNVPLPGVFVGPALTEAAQLFADMYRTFDRFFGDGTPPERPNAPEAPKMEPGTSNPEEDQAHKDNEKGAKKLDGNAREGNKHADETAEGTKDDKGKLAALWKEHEKNAQRTANGGTSDTENATIQSLRDGVRDMRNLASGAADNSAMRAGGLQMPNLGGLNPLGMGGGGMNPLGSMLGGGMPGGGMQGGGGLPFGLGAGADPNAAHQGQHVPSPFDNLHNGPDGPAGPAAPTTATDHPGGPTTDPSGHVNDKPGGTGHAIVADPAAVNSREIVAADGKEKVTAPDDVSAAVLKHALANPNTPNMAEAAYAAAGVTLPGNGADPGKVVGVGEIQTGDIVRLADRDALVFGNGKVLNPDGTLQPIDQAINASTLKGIFHVDRSGASTPSGSTTAVSKTENDVTATHPAAGDNG
ncbi:Uncharacterised protein [Mycobacteroides abscessus subsp. abscessus]|uniref:hypothetical protein n=1 Tax=Mycobacteroides abscessus TaxID=36809 RepID=UPI0009290A9B|nr:hypothetical protein [Mycobacteroides abscessus]SHU29900.1 Uncharacterised protein [Mycobacteroides abscessus subsp. abscessus]